MSIALQWGIAPGTEGRCSAAAVLPEQVEPELGRQGVPEAQGIFLGVARKRQWLYWSGLEGQA